MGAPPFTPADRNFMRKINHDFAKIGEDTIRDFNRALELMSGQFQMAIRAMGASLRTLVRATHGIRGDLLAYDRANIGGNGSDAYSPLWQSAVCSAWLHESCPDTDGGLQCSCTCHN